MQHGYSHTSDEGLLSFGATLQDRTPWKEIQGDALTDEQLADPNVIAGMRADQALKVMILSACNTLQAIFVGDFKTPAEASAESDRVQRLVHLDLAREELSNDPKRVEAAAYLRGVLLEGGTTGHTNLSYEQKADFLGKQEAMLGASKVEDAVLLLDMSERMAQVSATTSTFARSLGRSDKDADKSRSHRMRKAKRHGVAVLNNAHNTLSLWLSQAKGDAARKHFMALLAPFEELLARHVPKDAEDESQDAQPESGVGVETP